MQEQSPSQAKPLFHAQDGSSRAGRTRKALDPEYISIDERSIKDLLRFAREYAQELSYFNEKNEADGNWSNFLAKNSDDKEKELDDIAAYLKDPQRFRDDVERSAWLSRPHLILFLTFLELLQHARFQLNGLTRRHLEFYYREALRLTARQGSPDRVHVLVELADRQQQFLLPTGTRFQAGQDALGQPIFYRSDEDIVVNRAVVTEIKSLFAEKQVIGIRQARENPDILIELFPANKTILEEGEPADRSFMAMLMMALGKNGPGSELARYPNDRVVSAILLKELDSLLDFVPSVLYMSLSSFRALMKLKNEQTRVCDQEWPQVNQYLEEAGKRREPGFELVTAEPENFEQNIQTALGDDPFKEVIDELPEVDDIYDLYHWLDPKEVPDFIYKSFPMDVDTFHAMMKIVEKIHEGWRQIYEILRAAGRKKQIKNPGHQLEPPEIRMYAEDKFGDLLWKTLKTIDYSSVQNISLDDVLMRIVELEDYFHLSAEQFIFIRKISKQADARPWEWQQVYDILENAHNEVQSERAIPDRREALKGKMEEKGFEAMLRFALGDPNPGDPLPESRKFNDLDKDRDKDYVADKLFIEPANFEIIKGVVSKGRNATDDDWTSVYTILELAQRRKNKWQTDPAQIEQWENIYAAPDASQIQASQQVQGTTPRWKTFGEGYSISNFSKALIVSGNIGFAIASPLLALAEGERKITLTLVFHTEDFDKKAIQDAIKPPCPFVFLLSTEKEMVPVKKPEMTVLDVDKQPALQITLNLNEQAPAVAPLKTEKDIQTPWPMLQIRLADLLSNGEETDGKKEGEKEEKKTEKRLLKRYRLFQHLKLEEINLKVEVKEIAQFSLQNDDGFLDPKKPFEPFGMSPVAGNSLYFAHPELCSKKLDQLKMNIEWLGVPNDLSAHYQKYPSTVPIANNTVFKACLKLHDRRSFFKIVDGIQLFNADGASKASQSVIEQSTMTATGHYPEYARDVQLIMARDVLDWSRYWQLELLDPDFLHNLYPRAVAEGAKAEKPYSINPPYTPKIKRLTAGYSSSLKIKLTEADLSQQPDTLFYIEPFGYRDVRECASQSYFFLPQFENEGELFIGIKDLTPPQNLSLLFQMAEGSADPGLEREPVHWSFLDGNDWHSLEEGQLLSDTTNGLLNSGIIKFDLPPVKASTLLPVGPYWIRATIARNSGSIGDMIAIKTQAVSATFEEQGNDPDRLAQPLPAQSITSLAELLPEVKSIHQPYTSFGGKSPEQAGAFYTRASERLRHKDRALTAWDYEHMVLEAFPSVYKVKCLPAGTSEDPRLVDTVQIIVIPDIRGKLPFDPFEPKLPADVLLQIEQYLARRSPPDIRLLVKNPTYIRLKVRVGIRLRRDANPGFYRNAINEELQRYLAPWAYDHSAEIVFGGRIDTSLIVNFLEEHSYVDYVAGIKLITKQEGEKVDPSDESSKVLLDPAAILVSDRSHAIDLIAEEAYEQKFFTGINYMMIGLDFKIAAGTTAPAKENYS